MLIVNIHILRSLSLILTSNCRKIARTQSDSWNLLKEKGWNFFSSLHSNQVELGGGWGIIGNILEQKIQCKWSHLKWWPKNWLLAKKPNRQCDIWLGGEGTLDLVWPWGSDGYLGGLRPFQWASACCRMMLMRPTFKERKIEGLSEKKIRERKKEI